MKNKLKELIKLLFCLITFFSLGYLVAFILRQFNIDTSSLNIGYKMFIELVLTLIIFGFVMFIYFKDLKNDFKIFKRDLEKNITHIIKMFLIFMIVKYLVSVLSAFLMMAVGYEVESMTSVNQTVIEGYVKKFPWVMVVTTSVLAPLYEEVLFRLGLKKVIKNKILFVLISGFIFGIMHIFPLSDGVDLMLGIFQSISYVTMGFFLAYSYQKTNNIFTSIGIHFLNNFLSVLIMINMM